MATPLENLTEKQRSKVQLQLVREHLLRQIFKDHAIEWKNEPVVMRFYGKYIPRKGHLNRFGSIYITPNYLFFTNATLKGSTTDTHKPTFKRPKILSSSSDDGGDSDPEMLSEEAEDTDFMLTLDLDAELPVSRRGSQDIDVVIPIQRLEKVPELARHRFSHSLLELKLTTGISHQLLVLWIVPESNAVSKKQPAKLQALLRHLWLHPVMYVKVQQPTDEEWRAEQEQHLVRSAEAATDLVMPDVAIMEEMVGRAEEMLQRNVELRTMLQRQAEAIDRIDEHIDTVSNGLKSMRAELRTIESVTGHFKKMATDVDLLLKSKAKKERPDRKLSIPAGERFLVPVLYRQEKRLYLPAVMVFDDEEFFVAHPVGAVPKKAERKAETSGAFTIIDSQKYSYSSLMHVTAICRHQHLKIATTGSERLTVFSSYLQHIANELKMRTKHDFRLILHPNVRVFEWGHEEIRQVPVNVSGEDDGSGARDTVRTVRAKVSLYDPIIQFQSLEQKLGAEAQNKGVQQIREIMALLLEDSQIIQEELIRQTGQLRVQNDKARKQQAEASKVQQRIRRVA